MNSASVASAIGASDLPARALPARDPGYSDRSRGDAPPSLALPTIGAAVTSQRDGQPYSTVGQVGWRLATRPSP